MKNAVVLDDHAAANLRPFAVGIEDAEDQFWMGGAQFLELRVEPGAFSVIDRNDESGDSLFCGRRREVGRLLRTNFDKYLVTGASGGFQERTAAGAEGESDIGNAKGFC